MGYRNVSAITPSDSTNLPGVINGISVGVSGTVTVDTPFGSTNVALNLTAGVIYPVAIIKIHATGTSATGINGYW